MVSTVLCSWGGAGQGEGGHCWSASSRASTYTEGAVEGCHGAGQVAEGEGEAGEGDKVAQVGPGTPQEREAVGGGGGGGRSERGRQGSHPPSRGPHPPSQAKEAAESEEGGKLAGLEHNDGGEGQGLASRRGGRGDTQTLHCQVSGGAGLPSHSRAAPAADT